MAYSSIRAQSEVVLRILKSVDRAGQLDYPIPWATVAERYPLLRRHSLELVKEMFIQCANHGCLTGFVDYGDSFMLAGISEEARTFIGREFEGRHGLHRQLPWPSRQKRLQDAFLTPSTLVVCLVALSALPGQPQRLWIAGLLLIPLTLLYLFL